MRVIVAGLCIYLSFVNYGRAATGGVTAVVDGPRSARIVSGSVRAKLTALTPRVFRLRCEPGPAGLEAAIPELIVVKPETAYPPVSLSVDGGGETASVSTGALTVRFHAGSADTLVADVLDGERMLVQGWVLAPGAHRMGLRLAEGERVRGFGDKRAGLDQRGKTVEILNHDAFASETNASYKSVPFYWTDRGYGMLLHNWHPSNVDVGAAVPGQLAWTWSGGELDAYVFAGDSPRALLAAYTELTGRPAFLPRWFFGYHQGKASYHDTEGLEVAAEMRKRKLPLDTIYYDDKSDESIARPFVQALRNRYHVRLTMGGNPFLIGESPMIHQMGARGELLVDANHQPVIEPAEEIADDQGNADVVGYVDFFNAKAAEDFVKYEWMEAFRNGIVLGMADFGEMDHLKDPERRFWPSLELPVSATRNLYALAYGEAMVKAAQALAGGRPTGMVRPGFAGTQRLGWTTTADSLPTYQNFRAHLRALLNMTLTGFSNVGYDIGGWDSHGTADVFARWFAAGTFNPFMWAHGQGAHEPYSYGSAAENAARAWLGWRYRLLPYFYALGEEATRTGTPIQRPLCLQEPGDATGAVVDDQFFVGPDLLVAPLFNAEGSRPVYLPAGQWYDLFGAAASEEGARTVSRTNLPWDRLPVYVRAGAILPLGPEMQWSTEKPVDPLTVRFYARPGGGGGASSYELYEDDGVTLAYQQGTFHRTALKFTQGSGRVTFEATAKPGNGWMPPGRTTYRVELIGVSAPHHVRLAGRDVPFDAREGRVTFDVPAHPDPVVEIE